MPASELANKAARDDDFMEVAERLTGDHTFDVDALVAELVAESSVPFLPSQRYTASGRRRRREWEQVWELQRREDAGEDVGAIPKPPNYRTTDYQQRHIYDLRGKLDVPRERFTSYPGLEAQEGDQVITWAGLDYLQSAKALATFYFEARNARGWGHERLVPILAGLSDLLPWVEQWHPEPEASTGQPFADFLRRTIESQAVELGVSMDEIEKAQLG